MEIRLRGIRVVHTEKDGKRSGDYDCRPVARSMPPIQKIRSEVYFYTNFAKIALENVYPA